MTFKVSQHPLPDRISRKSQLGFVEKKTNFFSRYVAQIGHGVYKCYDFVINSPLLQRIQQVVNPIFPKISEKLHAAGPYIGKLKAVSVVGFIGSAAGLSRSARHMLRAKGTERLNYQLKTIHYFSMMADNTEKLVLTAYNFKWIEKLEQSGFKRSAAVLNTAVAWSRMIALMSWILTLSTIARRARKIATITAFQQEFKSEPDKNQWQNRSERELKKMLHIDGVKFKEQINKIEQNSFEDCVTRRLKQALQDHKVQLLAHSFNFFSTAFIYAGIGGPAGYVFLGGYFAATSYGSLSRKFHDYCFQRDLGFFSAPQQSVVAKIVHMTKWSLGMI